MSAQPVSLPTVYCLNIVLRVGGDDKIEVLNTEIEDARNQPILKDTCHIRVKLIDSPENLDETIADYRSKRQFLWWLQGAQRDDRYDETVWHGLQIKWWTLDEPDERTIDVAVSDWNRGLIGHDLFVGLTDEASEDD